jgi:hypothetical protein
MALNQANIRKAVFDAVELNSPATGLLSSDPSMIELTEQTLDIATRLATAIADTPAAYLEFDLLITDMQTHLFLIVDAPDRAVSITNANRDFLHRYRACVDKILATFGLTI